MLKRKYPNPCQITIRRCDNREMYVLSIEDYETYGNKQEVMEELSSCVDNIK